MTDTELKIKPNQTLLLQPCHARGARQIADIDEVLSTSSRVSKAVGISVTSSAPSTKLAVFGIGRHGKRDNNTFVAIPFWDVNTLNSSVAIYPGVSSLASSQIGGQPFKLEATVANFVDSARKATVMLAGGSGTDSTDKTVATLDVAPHSAAVVDLPDTVSDASLATSLIIRTDGSASDTLSTVQAISDIGVISTLPWKDQGQVQNGGEHPWIISNTLSSNVVLFNPDPALTNGSIQLTMYADGATWAKRLSVPPLATVAIPLNDIIQKQQSDDKGRKLPPTSSRGIVTWSSLAKPRIFGKLVQTDEISGIARSYACGEITSICNVTMQNADPTSVLIGQQTYVSIDQIQACTGCSGLSQ